jgi:hypothetical protein
MKRRTQSRVIVFAATSLVTFLAAACTNRAAFDDVTWMPDASSYLDQSSPNTSDATLGPASGKTITVQLQCGSCHTGNAGELAGSLSPVPGTQAYAPNLTPDKDTGLGSWTDGQIVDAIRIGQDNQGQELCPTMPRYGKLSDGEVGAIVDYLRSLPAVSNNVPDSICPPLKPGDDDRDGGDDGGDDGAEPEGGDGDEDSGGGRDGGEAGSPSDASTDGAPACSDFAAPNTPANCTCKAADAAACQPNGCYGGYYCYTTKNECWSSKPAGC